MKIIVAPNAFKGSLTAADAAHIIARSAQEVFPDAEIIQLPLADGGAGTLDALIETTLGDFLEDDCTNAVGETIVAPYGMLGQNGFEARTGVVEVAACCGLKDIPLRKRNPLVTTSYGVGELLMHAQQEGCINFIVCLGDTGTHDCGAGIAQAIGIKLLDKKGAEIGRGGAELLKLHAIDMSGISRPLAAAKVIAACDVANPLTGKNNTAKLYTPQKGADAKAVKILEEASEHFADIVKKELGKNIAKTECG
ncbi:MAG TPA: glycerate kinase, partial [Candidatus Kapabacteria bacterium]|nr:glycerate kinase [Candidatus Kapabacteria bacterium]